MSQELHTEEYQALVVSALEEDAAGDDVTTRATVPADLRVQARIVARSPGVLAGRGVAECVFAQLAEDFEFAGAEDGTSLQTDQVVLELAGPARALLAGERVALNFLQHLSGIASMTATFVQAVAGTGVAITDTRKTTPNLRVLEKYAVRCGGGVNHRSNLEEMLLVKENHIAAAGSVQAALHAALAAAEGRPVEIEVRNWQEFEVALALQPQRVLLDHWSPDEVRRAVRRRADEALPEIEVSGNLSLETIQQFAIEGVQYLSVGALTHSAPVLDLSLLVEG